MVPRSDQIGEIWSFDNSFSRKYLTHRDFQEKDRCVDIRIDGQTKM